MKSNISSFVIILFSNFLQAQPENNVHVKVPDNWIKSVQNYDYKQDPKNILIEFTHFIYPDSIFDKSFSGYINPVFINLDEDPEEELIGLFGRFIEEPTLAVFDKKGDEWFLIYNLPFMMFYREPELQIANNYSPNKTFYIRCLYQRGSGLYLDSYHFFKLIDGHVYHCLELINDARICGWGLLLNQDVSMEFTFTSAFSDAMGVEWNYNFYSGLNEVENFAYSGHPEIPFVKNENSVSFEWDSISKTYVPAFYSDSSFLNNEKIACFGAFGNDTLFVKAFRYEINQTLQEGTDQQKKLLKQYLERVEKMGNATAPNGELEQKGETESGLKFYGPKQ